MRKDVKELILHAFFDTAFEIFVLHWFGFPKVLIGIFIIFSFYNHINFINILVFNYKEVDGIDTNGFEKMILIKILKKFCSYETSEEDEERIFHFRVFGKKVNIGIPINSGIE